MKVWILSVCAPSLVGAYYLHPQTQVSYFYIIIYYIWHVLANWGAHNVLGWGGGGGGTKGKDPKVSAIGYGLVGGHYLHPQLNMPHFYKLIYYVMALAGAEGHKNERAENLINVQFDFFRKKTVKFKLKSKIRPKISAKMLL